MGEKTLTVTQVRDKGFTLVELQVSIAILLFACSGLAVLLMNDLRQLQWLEGKRQLYAFLPMDASKTLFTELTSVAMPSGAVNRARVQSFAVSGSSMTAVVVLEAR